MLFTGFQLYDPGSSILGSEDLRVRWWLTRGRMQPLLWHCCCRGGGRVLCDFSNPNLALESKYIAAVMEKKKTKQTCKYLNII